MARWADIEISGQVQDLLIALESHHNGVAAHRVYAELNSLAKVRTFMETHVFAVWDFMSLLSAIRIRLTCTTVPWLPVGSAEARRFINELFLAEDSDLHPDGACYTSHFELYLQAMRSAGAETAPIERFTNAIRAGASPLEALNLCDAPEPARRFVQYTWHVITKGSLGELLGAFTFGRESVIPSMFTSVRRLSVHATELDPFVAYLDRHIELDGDEHGPVALRMVSAVCAQDKDAWRDVLNGGRDALTARANMWDGLYERIIEFEPIAS